MTGTTTILRADARALPLADASVDLVVTSPPYFGLRSYQDGGQHYEGQLGDEPTPAEFVDALLDVTRECMRVLKPTGSMWVNLGDKYANGGRTSYDTTDINGARGGVRVPDGFQPKTLLGIPWRYALACIDQLGLILRAEVIWAKPNGLPESVTDRVRRSHEQWFHFVLNPRYYSAVDEVREEYLAPNATRTLGRQASTRKDSGRDGDRLDAADTMNPLGKLPGSVWTIPTQPLQVPDHLGVDHYAAFPMEWPRRIIQGWSPRQVCTACGEGRRPLSATDLGRKERDTPQYDSTGFARHGTGSSTLGSRGPSAVIIGYACACPDTAAPATAGVVLDPFSGTGTTALVAKAFDRHGIGVDLSADYCRLAEWRCNDPIELARAMQVERKPEPQIAGQAGLFD